MISAQDFLKQHPISDGMEERYTKPDSSAVGDVGQSACRGVKYAGHASRVRHATDNEDFDPRNFDACREAAFRLLDASARSTQTLRRRLLDKGYEDRTVDDVIERLIELGLLDDEAYARSVVRYCVKRLRGSLDGLRPGRRVDWTGRFACGGSGLREGAKAMTPTRCGVSRMSC